MGEHRAPKPEMRRPNLEIMRLKASIAASKTADNPRDLMDINTARDRAKLELGL